MGKLRQLFASLVVAACLVAVWWAAVLETKSVIFPTPLQVWTATLDLAQHGELWGHIGSSLFRVGVGFPARRRRGRSARPLHGVGQGRTYHVESDRPDPSPHLAHRLDSPCHTLVWRRRCLADISHFPSVVVSNDRADHRRSTHHRAAIYSGRQRISEFRAASSSSRS